MLESILSIIKKCTIDKGLRWSLLIATTLVLTDGIIDIMFCKPSIPLMIITSGIGIARLIFKFVKTSIKRED